MPAACSAAHNVSCGIQTRSTQELKLKKKKRREYKIRGIPQKAKERDTGEGHLSSAFLRRPAPPSGVYGLWGSVGWSRAMFN